MQAVIVCPFNRPSRIDRLLAMWQKQVSQAPLVLVANKRGTWAQPAEEAGAVVLVGPPSIGGAKNKGLEYARKVGAEWTIFIDDDNYYGSFYVREIRRAATAEVDVVSLGIAFVRWGQDLYCFETPLKFCPGHCTAVRTCLAPNFPEVNFAEDIAWSKALPPDARTVHLPPWHAIYERTGEGHAYDASQAEFMRSFGPARQIGTVPDSFVDRPCDLSSYSFTVSDEAVFQSLERRLERALP
jgi:hypothetical protein